MKELNDFINEKNVEKSNYLININDLNAVEEAIGVKLGTKIKEYLLKFGYLAYKYVELYGVNSRQGLISDMVKSTINIHKDFPITTSFIVLENIGDGDYILVDSNDYVYEFIPTLNNDIKALNKQIDEYILERFNKC